MSLRFRWYHSFIIILWLRKYSFCCFLSKTDDFSDQNNRILFHEISTTAIISVKPSFKPSTAPTSKPSKSSKPTAFPSLKIPKTQKPTNIPTTTAKPSFKSSKLPIAKPTISPSSDWLIFPVCSKGNLLFPVTASNICYVKSQLSAAINTKYNSLNTANEKAHFLSVGVRIAWHDAAEYDMNSNDLAGPDGCFSNRHQNKGLWENDSPIITFLEPFYQNYCDKISRADLWALFGKLCAEKASTNSNSLNINFQFGRVDRLSCQDGYGRIASAQGNLDTVTDIFINRLGLTLIDAVALLGAHGMGHVHTAYSGYGFNKSNNDPLAINAWQSNPGILNSDYYQSLLFKKNIWQNVMQPGDSSKNFWTPTSGRQTVMLNTDMSLAFPINSTVSTGDIGQNCSTYVSNGVYGCVSSTGVANYTTPLTYPLILNFSKQPRSYFFTQFSQSFTKMICVGYGVPNNVSGSTSTGKLGTLTYIDFNTC
eukprot:gene6766-9267_t